MRCRHILPLIMLAMAWPGARTRAQQPAAEYWNRLEQAGDVAQVATLQSPAGIDPELAEGMRFARRYDLSRDRTDAYRGRELLQRAAARAPLDALAQFALGALLVRGPDARVRPYEDPDDYFISPYSLAYIQGVRALRRALELEPQLGEAAGELLRLALERGDTSLAREAEAALGRAPACGAATLGRAQAALLRGRADSASALARTALVEGADRGLARHTEAAALLLDPAQEAAGTAAYFAGADRLTPAGAREYFRALAAIATDAEREGWARTPADGRGEWLRQFWEYRAARAGVTVAQRLGAHYRRLQQARLGFTLDSPMQRGSELSALTLGVDPRRYGLSVPGIMLVRHGDPYRLAVLTRCRFGVAQLVGSRRETRQLLNAIVPPDALGRDPQNLVRTELPGDMRVVCTPRGDDQLAGALSARLMRQLTVGDSYEPPFQLRLAFVAATYAFRGPADSTELLAAVSLPPGAARALASAGGAMSTRLSLVLLQDSPRAVQRTDQLERTQLPPSLLTAVPPAGLLTLLQASRNTSLRGRARYRIALTDNTGERAGGIAGGELEVPDFRGRGPQLSDVVLAPTDARGTWRRGDVALSPSPGRVYRAGEQVHLFYEVYHIAADERYRTEILVARERDGLWQGLRALVGGERDVVRLQFEERARAPHPQYGLQELRSVGTEYLAPGVYRLQVRVTNARTGESAVQARLLEIGP